MNQYSHELIDSLDLLKTLSRDGLKVVPTQPTDWMLQAGVQASGLSKDVISRLYSVMINTADESTPTYLN